MIFIWVSLIIFNVIAIFVPKYISRIEIYATCFFALSFGALADIVLDLYYDLYGYYEKGFQLISLLIFLLIYPAISTLFLNFFPFGKKFKRKLCYIVSWSLFSVGFEWYASQTEFFYHNEWKLWHSALAYPIIFSTLAGNLKLVRWLIKHPFKK